MNSYVLILILVSVSLSALAQISFKVGMSSERILGLPREGASLLEMILAILGSGHIILGFILYGCGAMFWLWVLAKLDVSLAYPFVGLGFILTMLFGFFFLGESLGVSRIAGTLLVFAGLMLIAHS